MAGDQMKISSRFAEMANIITGANFYARQENKRYIEEDHIKKLDWKRFNVPI